ncbi:MAG: polymer-forming cytoskeletal protein [Clostridiales bacterium]|nr:polymer-forming cytoskeletal protein [Clostridiales bacterium]
MGFFKEFKDDFSQAVNELIPEEGDMSLLDDEDLAVNTLESDVDVDAELSKLDGLLEEVSKKEAMTEPEAEAKAEDLDDIGTLSGLSELEDLGDLGGLEESEEAPEDDFSEEVQEETMIMQEEIGMDEQTMAPVGNEEKVISDEVSIITAGTTVRGDIVSNGSLDVQGEIDGNVTCNGKLVVTGVINGNSSSSEFFADAAQIEGEVESTGTVKIGVGSVIIGNISSSSAVVAGAIKGDIDVQGPVVVDTSAVVMGNIKSRSVQINNGAVIEGFCSQCYSDVDVESLFGRKKGN